MSPMTSFAPSAANRRTVASPIPEQPPVTTATRPSMRPATSVPFQWSWSRQARPTTGSCDLRSGRDEDVLLLGERVRRVRAELPAEPGHLVATERRPVADAGVAVDAEVAGLHPTGDAQRTPEVLGEDRPGQAVVGVVRQGDRLVLVLETHHRDDRPEHLLAPHRLTGVGGLDDGRGQPVPVAVGR